MQKLYSFIRIYNIENEKKYLNILIKRQQNYDPNKILNRINNMPFFKGAIKINLNITNFPLNNYNLYEEKSPGELKDTFQDEIMMDLMPYFLL